MGDKEEKKNDIIPEKQGNEKGKKKEGHKVYKNKGEKTKDKKETRKGREEKCRPGVSKIKFRFVIHDMISQQMHPCQHWRPKDILLKYLFFRAKIFSRCHLINLSKYRK